MRFRRPTRREAVINIAPLVDCVFLLIIFFAATTTFIEDAGLELELPASSSTAERESQPLTVSLDAEGRLALEGQVIGREELGERLRQELAKREKKQVHLRADTRAQHGDVVRLMDLVREAGADGLAVDARPVPE